MDILLSTTEKSYANETISKILFITFSTNQTHIIDIQA